MLFPPRCPLCDEPVERGRTGFCKECSGKWKPEVHFISGEGHKFAEGAFLCKYEEAALAMYRFKYGGRREYGKVFGRQMACEMKYLLQEWGADGIVPIPLHPRRIRKRGYNQAQVLASALGEQAGIPVYTNLLERCRDTAPQKELNALERQNNLKKAFKIYKNDVKLSTIIIVDDIYTTGTTVDEAASVLLAGSVKKVYVLTLASGMG
ncbi:MAG: ComF family protein [Lachnospiraceae bacterium]|nr:ComF family protein [Lachnospiraceae bacterium]